MPNNKSRNPNGREVLVFEGKEIAREAMEKLSDEQVTEVKKRTNGPHHEAKWARDLSDIVCENNLVHKNFWGEPTVVELRNIVIHAHWPHQRLMPTCLIVGIR